MNSEVLAVNLPMRPYKPMETPRLPVEDVRNYMQNLHFEEAAIQLALLDLGGPQAVIDIIKRHLPDFDPFKAQQACGVEWLRLKPVLVKLGLPVTTSTTLPEIKAFLDSHTETAPAYQDILRIVYEAGVEMERHPSICADKDEETLRDHFLMVLSPHFQSTTGETFNKKGKTDILIRHEKENVFVAECKFWSGIKGFHTTIDQLLGYLTWRDSKVAVVSFVKNKELTPVLDTIEKETQSHGCFVKSHGKKKDGWFMFEFHLPGDSGRSVQLAILVFHFP